MANTFEDILEPSSNNTPQNIMSFEDILSQEDSAQTLPSANSFEDILTQGDTTQVVPYSDDSNPNSFTNLFLFGKDNVEREIYKSLNLYSDEIGEAYPELGEKLKNFSLEGIERNKQQIESRPIPTADLSFSKILDKVKEDIGEGNYLDALSEAGLWAKQTAARGLGSTIPILGPGIATAVAAPYVGISGAPLWTLSLFSTLIPSSLAQRAGVYEEAKYLGASEEKARQYSHYGGIVMGLLDRAVPAALISQVFNRFGKDQGIKLIKNKVAKEVSESTGKKITEAGVQKTAKEITEEVSKKVVKKNGKYVPSEKFVAPSTLSQAIKSSLKIGMAEGATEAAQEGTQILTSRLAADKNISPEEIPIIKERLIDAAAAGWITGKTMGLGSGTLSGMMDANVVAEANANMEAYDKALPNIKQFPDTLQDVIEGEGKLGAKTNWIDVFFRRSITPLKSFASKGERQRRIYNMFNNYYNDVSAEVGTKGEKIEEAIQKVRRNIKLPILMRSMSKGKNDQLYRYLRYGEESKDARINAAGKILREEVLGDVISDAIKINKIDLELAIKNNLEILPEIQQALTEGRINVRKAEQLNKAFNNLKSKYTDAFDQSTIDVTTGLEIDPQFIEQTQAKALLEMQQDPDYLSLSDKEIAPFIATGFLADFQKAGLDIGAVKNYLPRVYKVGLPWQKRKFKNVLMKKFNMSKEEASDLVEKIRGEGGVFVHPEAEVSLNPFPGDAPITPTEESFEKGRTINDEMFKALDDAGLVERNVKKIIDKYNIEAVQRLKVKELADTVNTTFKEMKEEGTLGDTEKKELSLMQDIFNAIQNRHSPMRSQSLKKAQKNFLTYQYMLTLPLSALTALTEPLIVLSRVDPKHVLFGSIQAARNVGRQTMRSVFPKIPLSEAEQASTSILQLYDGTLAERLGDIAGVDVNRKITDKFFKAIMLTQITQLSRDIAFQSGLRQSRQDMLNVLRGRASGKFNRGQIKSLKRLREMGLTETNFTTPEMVAWLEGPIGGKPPIIMRKALSKFVDEIIMAPNAINRPLWMSNPNYAMVAQLKGFMMTFGNTVGMRMYREVFKPLAQGRVPAGEALKYAVAFTLIVAGSIGIKDMKDWLRYGDEDSPWKDAKGFSQIWQALIDSNLFGPGTVFYDALLSFKYGAPPIGVILGPGVQWLSNALAAAGQFALGSPRAAARFLKSAFLPTSIVSGKKAEDIIEGIEKAITPASEKLGEIFEFN